MWEATVAGARERPPWQLDERVDGEWSFIETQRHLVHVTDVWVREVIEEAESPYHPWGMPPDFAQGRAGDLGLTLDARPNLDEVLALRHERAAHVAAGRRRPRRPRAAPLLPATRRPLHGRRRAADGDVRRVGAPPVRHP
jgi:hypothetical protein